MTDDSTELATLFAELIELEPPDRDKRLREIGTLDTAVRARLEALLDADAEAEGRWQAEASTEVREVQPLRRLRRIRCRPAAPGTGVPGRCPVPIQMSRTQMSRTPMGTTQMGTTRAPSSAGVSPRRGRGCRLPSPPSSSP